MKRRVAFIYEDALSRHELRSDHPMRPVRLRYTYQLLEEYGAFNHPGAVLLNPRSATEEELALDANKIEIVVSDGRVLYLDRDALAALPDGIEDVSTRVPGRSGCAADVKALIAANGLPTGGEVVVVASDGFVSPPVPTRTLAAGLLLA